MGLDRLTSIDYVIIAPLDKQGNTVETLFQRYQRQENIKPKKQVTLKRVL